MDKLYLYAADEGARTETVDVFEAIQETQRGLELLVSQNIPMSERSMAQMVDAQRKKREMQSITGLAGLSTGFQELDKRTEALQTRICLLLVAALEAGKPHGW